MNLGFNNAVILRKEKNPVYHLLLGFTAEEIGTNFSKSIEDIMKIKNYENKEDVLKELKSYYNGFRMSHNATISLYNPFAIQNYFRNDGDLIPYFAESGGTKILYDALKSQSFEQLTDFLKYILDEEKKIPIDIQKFMEPKPWNIFRNDFNQIAFDAGHLTLEKIGNNFFLKATNQEMRENFSKLINEHFFKNQNYDTLFHNFEKHDLRGFFNSLESIVFQNKSILNLK